MNTKHLHFLRNPKYKVLKWIFSFLVPYKKNLAIVVITSLAISISSLIIPKVIQSFIDSSLGEKNFVLSNFYKNLFLVTVIIITLTLILIPINRYNQRKLQEYCSRDLQLAVLKKLRDLDAEYFEKSSKGKILSLLNNEVRNVQKLYHQVVPRFIEELLFTVISLIFMIATSVQLSIVIIPILIIYYSMGPWVQKKATLNAQELSKVRINLNGKIYETLSSLKELKVNRSLEWDNDKYIKHQNKFNTTMLRMYFYVFLEGTIRRMSYYLGAIILMVLGFYLINNKYITVGEFVAFFLYYFNGIHRLTSVITLILEQKVIASQSINLFNFISKESTFNSVLTTSDLNKSNDYAIKFKDINFGYPEGKQVLQDFNLEIKRGEKVAIVGESGCGKSTVLKLLVRVYEPCSGQILLYGNSIKKINHNQLRDMIGFVTQDTYLFSTSIYENIRFGNPDAEIDKVIEVAKLANAHQFISNTRYGYNTLIGDKGIKLSGGQKQRLALARTLIKDSDIVLLDEATSALDNKNEEEILEKLEQILKDKTVIAVTHRISSVRNFDKIVVISEGKIVESGTYQELLVRKGHFFNLVNSDRKLLEV
jgi:ATP-binding cassette, subfamily B, bacterial